MNLPTSDVFKPAEGEGASAVATAPGALRGEAWLQVHTRHAQRLVHGRPARDGKPAIVGLMGFAQTVRPMWSAARAGDPYAHWWLSKVQSRLEEAHGLLRARQADLDAVLGQSEALAVSLAASLSPIRVPLRFGNPYGFQGARLIARLDTLARTTLTARHVALITGAEAERGLGLSMRAVRRVFASPQGYRAFGITVLDVTEGTARALRARAAMGELPAGFLDVPQGTDLAPEPVITILPNED